MTATPQPPKKGSGWPSVSTNRAVERLGRNLERFPFKMARQLKAELNGWSNVSVCTIQKVCQRKLKMPSSSAAKKLLLTARMVRKRLQFAKSTEKDCEKVMFLDESTFRLVNPRAQRVRWPTQTNRYKQKYVVVNVKHSASVMVWGFFSGIGGRGSLYFLPPKTTKNGDRYIQMLKEKLLFWMNHHKASHFLQDGAPC